MIYDSVLVYVKISCIERNVLSARGAYADFAKLLNNKYFAFSLGPEAVPRLRCRGYNNVSLYHLNQAIAGTGFTSTELVVMKLFIPVITEGRIYDTYDLKKVLKIGPHAVVIGTAITRSSGYRTRRSMQSRIMGI